MTRLEIRTLDGFLAARWRQRFSYSWLSRIGPEPDQLSVVLDYFVPGPDDIIARIETCSGQTVVRP